MESLHLFANSQIGIDIAVNGVSTLISLSLHDVFNFTVNANSSLHLVPRRGKWIPR